MVGKVIRETLRKLENERLDRFKHIITRYVRSCLRHSKVIEATCCRNDQIANVSAGGHWSGAAASDRTTASPPKDRVSQWENSV